jgi:hypothetical protein
MSNPNDPSEFLLAEYKELRGEILKRSEFQHQLISIALVALGGLAAVGLKDSPSALLAYPMLVLFLAAGWTSNGIQISQIGIYIRYRIEKRLVGPDGAWEHRAIVSGTASKKIGALHKLATRGILLGSEFLAIGLYLLKRLSSGWPIPAERKGEVVLLLLSLAAIAFTMWIMRSRDHLVDQIVQSMRKPVVAPPASES